MALGLSAPIYQKKMTLENNTPQGLSIIIPAYNEAESLESVIAGLKQELTKLVLENYEIIVVNDGSTDKTVEILMQIEGIKVKSHPYNKGYGAALKTGAVAARFNWLLFFDAEGQHRPEYIKELLKYATGFDLIAGERLGYQGPWLRQPAKKVIHALAFYLFGQKVKDLNCGLRLIKKDQFLRFSHILPDGFSCSTTTVFTFFKEKLNVKFVPVIINKRGAGKSLVRPRQAFIYFLLILRLLMLFSPLRAFLPLSVVLFALALVIFLYDIFLIHGFHNMTISLLLFSSLMIFFFGLLADQVAALRREIRLH